MPDLADLHTTTAGTGALVGTARSAVSGSTATVEVGGVNVTARVTRGLTLAVGDAVLILRQGAAWWVTDRLGTATPAAPPAGSGSTTSPDAPAAVTTGSLPIAPVETRSWNGSSWRTDSDDVRQGQYGGWGLHTGCAFYGGAARSLAGATVTGARVYLRRTAGGDYAARPLTYVLITQATRPAGAPGVGASGAGPSLAVGAEGVYGVPTWIAQALVDGNAGGIGVYVAGGSPYIRTAGRGDWGPAWTLVIDWRR